MFNNNKKAATKKKGHIFIKVLIDEHFGDVKIPFIAFAMHQCVNAPIEETVLSLEAHNPEWA